MPLSVALHLPAMCDSGRTVFSLARVQVSFVASLEWLFALDINRADYVLFCLIGAIQSRRGLRTHRREPVRETQTRTEPAHPRVCTAPGIAGRSAQSARGTPLTLFSGAI